MKRFAFRLEPVLRLRSGELDQGRRRLARAEQALAAADERARRAAHEAQAEAEQTLAGLARGTHASWLRSLWAGTQRRFEAVGDAQRELSQQSAAVQQTRAALLETWRAARSLEWLKQQLLERERAFRARLEERELDDRTRRTTAAEER